MVHSKLDPLVNRKIEIKHFVFGHFHSGSGSLGFVFFAISTQEVLRITSFFLSIFELKANMPRADLAAFMVEHYLEQPGTRPMARICFLPMPHLGFGDF